MRLRTSGLSPATDASQLSPCTLDLAPRVRALRALKSYNFDIQQRFSSRAWPHRLTLPGARPACLPRKKHHPAEQYVIQLHQNKLAHVRLEYAVHGCLEFGRCIKRRPSTQTSSTAINTCIFQQLKEVTKPGITQAITKKTRKCHAMINK